MSGRKKASEDDDASGGVATLPTNGTKERHILPVVAQFVKSSCGRCFHYAPYNNKATGVCFRYPPSVQTSTQPQVGANQRSCGEFAPLATGEQK